MPFVVADSAPLPRMAAIPAEPVPIPSPPVTTWAMRPGEHGLTRLDTPRASDKADPREDAFIRPALHRAMTTAVSRTSPPTPPNRNPRSRQCFRAADRDLRLSCDRTEAPHRRGLRGQVTAVLPCATSEASRPARPRPAGRPRDRPT